VARAGRGLSLLCLLLLSCGLVHKDVEVIAPFVAGGGAPSDPQVDISTPLVASQGDLAHLSAVTLRAARIEATDGQGPISFLTGATLTLHANGGLTDLQLATLPAPPSTDRADLTVDSTRDLKPYLQAGAVLIPKFTYSPRPVTARGLQLVLTVRGSL